MYRNTTCCYFTYIACIVRHVQSAPKANEPHRLALVRLTRFCPRRLSGPTGSGASKPASRSCSLNGMALCSRFRVPSPVPESSGAGWTPRLKSFLVFRMLAFIRCVGYLRSESCQFRAYVQLLVIDIAHFIRILNAASALQLWMAFLVVI